MLNALQEITPKLQILFKNIVSLLKLEEQRLNKTLKKYTDQELVLQFKVLLANRGKSSQAQKGVSYQVSFALLFIFLLIVLSGWVSLFLPPTKKTVSPVGSIPSPYCFNRLYHITFICLIII